uniref:GATA-type domain-containing protein n=1 Tax=Meloidogyne enterolobii TaxID=390850 RepID=A0A6V7W0R4_MELEN|nr:unnamed protein product [Meloidogyne enterolobii]
MKFIIVSHLYLFSLLNIKCDGRKVSIEVKIIDDWEEKREFIYLKNVELKERFVLEKIDKGNNKYDISYNYNIEGFLHRIGVNREENIFNIELDDRSEYAEELKRRLLITIANNKIFQNILIGFEKRLLRRNQFNKTRNNYYETSILDETLDHIKINKNELLKENIQNYLNKLLSSYWTEINLIGYKIELLEKQKVECPNKLKNRINDIGKKISGIIEVNKRKCFNCTVTQTKQWYNLLKEHSLCEQCGAYKRKFGKFRSKELWFKTTKRNTPDRNCYICRVIKTSKWYRHSELEQYICKACYEKRKRIKKIN